MQLISHLLSLALAGSALAAPAAIAAYDASAAERFGYYASDLSASTVSALLAVIKNYNLENDFGVYTLHEHMSYSTGEAPYESYSDGTYALSTVVDYSTIATSSVPMIYGIDTDSSELVPIEFASASAVSSAAQSGLETAIANGFVRDYAAVIKGLPAEQQTVAGFGAMTGLAQSALVNPSTAVVLSSNPTTNTLAYALVPVANINTPAEPTLFAWTSDGTQVVWYCQPTNP